MKGQAKPLQRFQWMLVHLFYFIFKPNKTKKKTKLFQELKKQLEGYSYSRNAPKNEDELRKKQDWKFWNTQPVKSFSENVPSGVNEPIEIDKKIEEIKQDPFTLPDGFQWDDIDLNSTEQVIHIFKRN